jgi:hypothetical protein
VVVVVVVVVAAAAAAAAAAVVVVVAVVVAVGVVAAMVVRQYTPRNRGGTLAQGALKHSATPTHRFDVGHVVVGRHNGAVNLVLAPLSTNRQRHRR